MLSLQKKQKKKKQRGVGTLKAFTDVHSLFPYAVYLTHEGKVLLQDKQTMVAVRLQLLQ